MLTLFQQEFQFEIFFIEFKDIILFKTISATTAKVSRFLFVPSQPVHDLLWKSPEGPNIRDLQGTFRGLSEDRHKNWRFIEKMVF